MISALSTGPIRTDQKIKTKRMTILRYQASSSYVFVNDRTVTLTQYECRFPIPETTYTLKGILAQNR